MLDRLGFQCYQQQRCLPLHGPTFSFLHSDTSDTFIFSRAYTNPPNQVQKDRGTLGEVSQDEAMEYLTATLRIPDPVAMREQNAYNFLCEVHRRTRLTQPYNNVIYLQDDGPRYPTLEENKEVMRKRKGGSCLGINSFTKELLQAMGYEAYNPSATIPKERSSQYEAHRALFVKNASHPGSIHLLEPGTVHPILEPIPLDFKRVSPIYQLVSTHQMFRMFRDCPGIVKLCTLAINSAAAQSGQREDANVYIEDGRAWKVLITYHDQEQSLSYAYSLLERALENVKDPFNVFLKELIIIGLSGNLWTSIRGKNFTQYSEDGRRISQRFDTDKEIIDTARKCFPQYSQVELEKTINYCNSFTKTMVHL